MSSNRTPTPLALVVTEPVIWNAEEPTMIVEVARLKSLTYGVVGGTICPCSSAVSGGSPGSAPSTNSADCARSGS